MCVAVYSRLLMEKLQVVLLCAFKHWEVRVLLCSLLRMNGNSCDYGWPMETLNVVVLPGPSPSCSTHLPAALMMGNTGRSLGKTKTELSLVSSQRAWWTGFPFFLAIFTCWCKVQMLLVTKHLWQRKTVCCYKLSQTGKHAKKWIINSIYQVHAWKTVSTSIAVSHLWTSSHFKGSHHTDQTNSANSMSISTHTTLW